MLQIHTMNTIHKLVNIRHLREVQRLIISDGVQAQFGDWPWIYCQHENEFTWDHDNRGSTKFTDTIWIQLWIKHLTTPSSTWPICVSAIPHLSLKKISLVQEITFFLYPWVLLNKSSVSQWKLQAVSQHNSGPLDFASMTNPHFCLWKISAVSSWQEQTEEQWQHFQSFTTLKIFF